MPSSENQQPRWTWGAALLCCVYSLGVVLTLLVYGLWQEKVMSRPYHTGTNIGEYLSAFDTTAVPSDNPTAWPTVDDYFQSSLLLVLISRVFGLAFAMVMMAASGEPLGWQASSWQYLLMAVLTVAASACQFEALKYVTFTMQILGKSFKMFPLMLWGFMVRGKSYRVLDWIVGFFFCGGVIAYLAGGQVSPEHNDGNAAWGIFLLVSFIALDNITSMYQDKVFVEGGSAKYNQMLYINIFSAVLAVVVMGIRGEWGPTVAFCSNRPLVLADASIMSSSAVLAQWLVYAQVQGFGSLAFLATMFVRQVASIVASVVVFHHYETPLQIAALSVCCWALLWQVVGGIWQQQPGEQTPLLGEEKKDSAGKPASKAQLCVPRAGREKAGP